MRRRVYDLRREGRAVVLRRRRPVVCRLTRVLLAVPLATGAAVDGWRLAGAVAGPVLRAGCAVVMLGLVVVIVAACRGDRR